MIVILLNVKYKCTENFGKEDFCPFIFDWIINTRDLRYHMDLVEQDYDNYQVYEYQKKKLRFVDYSDAGIMAAYHTDTDSYGIEWRLSVVFKYDLHELYVQMSNSETSQSGKFLRKFKIRWQQFPVHTLVSANMPPYIREMGHVYDAVILLLGLFFILWCAAGLVRFFVRPKRLDLQVNPNSLYPIRLERLYGTPSMIFRAKDNQGNILTALSSRWDSLLMFFGIIVMLVSLITMAGASLCEQLRLLHLSAFAYNTVYSVTSLSLPLGFLIFFCAIVWGQVTMNEVSLFDRKGKKAAVLLQKGYSLFEERYQLFFINSKEILLAKRKRFGLRRQWTLLSKDQIEFATIKERSVKRALVRMCCGHLWGLLRADYDISGVMDSHGVIENTHALETVTNGTPGLINY